MSAVSRGLIVLHEVEPATECVAVRLKVRPFCAGPDYADMASYGVSSNPAHDHLTSCAHTLKAIGHTQDGLNIVDA